MSRLESGFPLEEQLVTAEEAEYYNKHRRVTMQKSALHLLDAPLPPSSDSFDLLTGLGIPRPTVCDSVMLAMVVRAQRGDVDAARFLRDTSGQKTTMTTYQPIEGTIDRLDLRSLSDEELYALAEATDDDDEAV